MFVQLHLKHESEYQEGELVALAESIGKLLHTLEISRVRSLLLDEQALLQLQANRYPAAAVEEPAGEEAEPEPAVVRLQVWCNRAQIEPHIVRGLPAHLMREVKYTYV
ncbi:MAG TPA: hypothetical protein PLS90_09395 [Candidatus Sumerlaeota bacterium]|nr:hypothetical protein [Candidatus Sumerlaeota bacterium]HOR29054.1 hypothetical protein [Candidatus Sumerlaeota bacterium]HPK02659.1 hypothetical protein [Candidatus Sumerlaeota bacterium]